MPKGIYKHKPTQGFQKGHKGWNKGLPVELQPWGGKHLSEEHKRKISKNHSPLSHHFQKGQINPMKGKKHSQESKEKISKQLKGKKRKPFTKEHIKKIIEGRKGYKPSEETKRKISLANKGKKHTEEFKKKMSLLRKGKPFYQTKGNKHWNWKGGITSLNLENRFSNEYQIWRKAIFERDNYICQSCGQQGGKIEAHHILSFAKFPHKRFDITNGQTLCKNCHKKTKNYLKGKKER